MAVLFILEVDNTMYALGLTDRQRAWLETVEVRRAMIGVAAARATGDISGAVAGAGAGLRELCE